MTVRLFAIAAVSAGLWLVGVGTGNGQQKTEKKRTQAPIEKSDEAAQEHQRLMQQHREAVVEFFRPLNEAKTEEERSKIRLDFARHPSQAFVPKFLALAEKHPKTRAALHLLAFVVQNS
jgi:hypothetical protein